MKQEFIKNCTPVFTRLTIINEGIFFSGVFFISPFYHMYVKNHAKIQPNPILNYEASLFLSSLYPEYHFQHFTVIFCYSISNNEYLYDFSSVKDLASASLCGHSITTLNTSLTPTNSTRNDSRRRTSITSTPSHTCLLG